MGGIGRPWLLRRVSRKRRAGSSPVSSTKQSNAGLAELVDALGLGSSEAIRGSSSLLSRTKWASGEMVDTYAKVKYVSTKKYSL